MNQVRILTGRRAGRWSHMPACIVLGIVALLGALVPLGGCESASGVVMPAPGVDLVSDADADAVGLLRKDPARPFMVVGRVRAFADARFEARIDEARAAAERALRRQGAAVGADAVVIDEAIVAHIEGAAVENPLAGLGVDDRNRQRPGGPGIATRPFKRVILTGRAVRYEINTTPRTPQGVEGNKEESLGSGDSGDSGGSSG